MWGDVVEGRGSHLLYGATQRLDVCGVREHGSDDLLQHLVEMHVHDLTCRRLHDSKEELYRLREALEEVDDG